MWICLFISAVNGNLDIINNKIAITFPAANSTTDVKMSVIIPLNNDDIVEAEEGFYLVITVNTSLSHSTNVSNMDVLRNGVALIRIKDDDSKAFNSSVIVSVVWFCRSTSYQFDFRTAVIPQSECVNTVRHGSACSSASTI